MILLVKITCIHNYNFYSPQKTVNSPFKKGPKGCQFIRESLLTLWKTDKENTLRKLVTRNDKLKQGSTASPLSKEKQNTKCIN